MSDHHDALDVGPVVVLDERLPKLDPHGAVSHTEHGLTYLEEGWFSMEQGGPLRGEPGTFTIVPAGVPHRILAGRDMHYRMLGFCATCLSLDERQVLMSPFAAVRRGAPAVVEVPKGRRRRVRDLYRALEDETRRGVPEAPELVRSLVLLLLGEVRRAMPLEAAQSAASSLASEALAVIQQRCREPISLRDVAAAVHRSAAHVTSTVKRETGYSVGEWITAGRVAEAAARLTHTDDSLEEIAERVGWRDKTHLIRQFRKAYGRTPAVYRREQRARHEAPMAARRTRQR